MSYLVVELALWILAAYFAGCVVGSVMHNVLDPRRKGTPHAKRDGGADGARD